MTGPWSPHSSGKALSRLRCARHGVPAADEPLLWLPDIAAGAAALAETGDATYWNDLAAVFSVERFLLT